MASAKCANGTGAPTPLPAKMRKRIALQAAMPKVQALVEEHGFPAIAAALYRVKKYRRELQRLGEIKREAARLEKRMERA